MMARSTVMRRCPPRLAAAPLVPRGHRGRLVVGVALLTATVACKRGNPPSLLEVGNQVAAVGEPLVIQLIASDPEDDELSFGYQAPAVPSLLETTSLTETPTGLGIFTFTPLATQIGVHLFDFSASDGQHTTHVVSLIDVRGASGSGTTPVFRSPLGSGTVLDLDQAECVALEIEIDDPDSSRITLGERPPLIEGASLAPEPDGRAGTWRWCPTRRQIEANDRYTLTLAADDGDNPVVTKEFVIVLRRRKGDECPGEAPVIEHTPMDLTTTLELPIVAEIGDDQGLGTTPYVVFAHEDPGDPIDFSKTTLVQMERIGGSLQQGTWRGFVPNLLANQPEGTAGPVFYLISATDDDDAEGDCDHRTDAPSSGMHRITVTVGGNETAGPCDPCSYDLQCGEAEDLCLPTGSGGRCGRACAGDGDCGDDFVCSPSAVVSVEGQAARQCIPLTGSCQSGGGGTCEDDDSEPNDTPAQAVAQGALAPGVLVDRMLCVNDDWFAVELAQQGRIEASIQGSNPPDIDLSLTTQDGVLLEASTGLSSSEMVGSDCLDPGTYLLRVYTPEAGSSGSYDLQLVLPGCGAGGTGDCCVDNNSPGCDDPTIEGCVCALDGFCCDTEWDDLCAGLAASDCGACGGGGSGGMDEGCCTAHTTGGCDDPTIESCVCAFDPYCCDTQWDGVCVGRVGNDLCAPACEPDDADGPCCQANGTSGCEINAVESCVCAADPFCCSDTWDAMCVAAIVANDCGQCP